MTDYVMQQKRAFHAAQSVAADWMERFQAELEFCKSLCEWLPEQAKGWQPLLKDAAGIVEAAARTGELLSIETAVKQAELVLAPLGRAGKGYTVYCAGHAHIDMNWMWSWPETVAVTNDTFSTVLKLMDEFPEFHFSQSQASTYAIIEKYHPALLKKIARRVKDGRWEVIASHWVENDKNLAGPESLCRHLLHTRNYIQKLFGLKAEDVPIDWSPDTFGHAATVPSYLVRGGVKYLYLHRPGGEGPKRPVAFWWQAPDGSKVLTRNDMAFGYNGVVAPENLLASLRLFVSETGLPMTLYVFGVGDHGGGPTRRDLLRGRDMMTWPIFPTLRFTTTRAFFEDLEKRGSKLPLLDCELNVEFTGCYTTQTLIKKGNRYGECKLTDAEIVASLAWAALKRPFPAAALTEGWQDILFNHFHDILPGSGVHDTRTYAHGLFQKTMAMTSMEETQSLRLLAGSVDTAAFGDGNDATADAPASRVSSGQGAGVGFGTANGALSAAQQGLGQGNRPFLVFNPTSWERTEVVEATIWDNPGVGPALVPFRSRSYAVKLADGSVIPAQVVNSGNWYWGHEYLTVAFPVRVPALGYTTCAIVEAAAPAAPSAVKHIGRAHHCFYAKHEREPEGLENDLVTFALDMSTGGIKSLVDKRRGTAVIATSGLAPVLEYGVEIPHGMTAWVIDHNNPVEYPQVIGLARKWGGPYKAGLEVKFKVKESEFAITYELRSGDPQVYIHLTGTWFQRGTPQTGIPFLRFVFPFALEGAKARYEIPFGAQERTQNQGQEVPGQTWAEVSGTVGGTAAGCLLVNDSKYGYSLDGSTLRLTLIRSSYDPDTLPEIGQHEVHAALRPFGGELPVAEAMRAGRDFNHALRVIGTDVHDGELPASASLLSVAPAGVMVNCVKKAEKASGLVLIVSDPTGKDTTVTAEFNTRLLGSVKSATEVDLIERPLPKSSAKVQGTKKVSFRLPARGIASVLVCFNRL